MQQNTQKNLWLDILFITVLTGLFYAVFLGVRPLTNPDESRYANAALLMLMHHNYVTPTINGMPFLDKPILYYWIEALALKCFGVHNWVIRLPQLLFGVIGVLAVYLTGRKLFDRTTGLWSAAILATSLLYFVFSHYNNMSLEVAVWISLSLFGFMLAQRDHLSTASRRYWMWGAYFCASCAFLTKGMMGLVFPILIIGAWTIVRNQWSILKRMHLVSGLVIFLAVVTPWFVAVQLQNSWFLKYFFYDQQIHRFLGSGFNNAMPIWFYLPIIIFGFYPWSLFALPSMRRWHHLWRQRQQQPDILLLTLWVVLLTIFFSIPQSKIIDYILPIFPAFALLLGRYIAQQWHVPSKGLRVMLVLNSLCTLILALTLIALPIINTHIPHSITPQLKVLAAILLITGGLTVLCTARRKQRPALILWVIAMVLFEWLALTIVPHVDQNNSVKLTNVIKPYVKPNDVIATYSIYYQDVPLLLKSHVIVVYFWRNQAVLNTDNWARKMMIALQHDPKFKDTLWLQKHFQQFLRHTNKTIFAFTNPIYWPQIQSWRPKVQCLAYAHGRIVFTNNAQIAQRIRQSGPHGCQHLTTH